MNLQNAQTYSKIYYGMHSQSGVVGYPEKEGQPKIYFSDETLASMNPTFAGKPVVVRHVSAGMTPDKASEVAHGYVIKSFFNKADGKHWAQFLVFTDEAIEAIEKKNWKLSNANNCRMAGEGRHSGIPYNNEAIAGEYEHLAIVPNPRYDSIILDEANFALYNIEKEKELTNLANSINNENQEVTSMLKLFTKQKVEDTEAKALENKVISLPKSGREMTIVQLANEMDEAIVQNAEAAKTPYMCNGEERVKVGDEEMSVNELLAKHQEVMKNSLSAAVPAGAESKAAAAAPKPSAANSPTPALPAKPAVTEESQPSMQNDDGTIVPVEPKVGHMESLMNADSAPKASAAQAPVWENKKDQATRGASRYGSKK